MSDIPLPKITEKARLLKVESLEAMEEAELPELEEMKK